MEHDHIAEQSLIPRYVAGDLAESVREAFEEHLVECARCAADVELEQTFRAGMRELGEDAAAPRVHRRSGFLWHPAWAAVAAMLAVTTGWQAYRLREAGRQPALAEQSTSAAAIAGPVYSLTMVREGGGGDPAAADRVVIPSHSQYVILSFDIREVPPGAVFSLEIDDPSGVRVWRQQQPAGAGQDSLGVGVPASVLRRGEVMQAVLDATLPDGRSSTVGRYRFAVDAR